MFVQFKVKTGQVRVGVVTLKVLNEWLKKKKLQVNMVTFQMYDCTNVVSITKNKEIFHINLWKFELPS